MLLTCNSSFYYKVNFRNIFLSANGTENCLRTVTEMNSTNTFKYTLRSVGKLPVFPTI